MCRSVKKKKNPGIWCIAEIKSFQTDNNSTNINRACLLCCMITNVDFLLCAFLLFNNFKYMYMTNFN